MDTTIDKTTIEDEEEEASIIGITIIMGIITTLITITKIKIIIHSIIKDLLLLLDRKVRQGGKIFNKIKVERLIKNRYQDQSQSHLQGIIKRLTIIRKFLLQDQSHLQRIKRIIIIKRFHLQDQSHLQEIRRIITTIKRSLLQDLNLPQEFKKIIITKRTLHQDQSRLQEPKIITTTTRKAHLQDQSLLHEIQKGMIIPTTLVIISVKILKKINKSNKTKRGHLLVQFPNLHQKKFNQNQRDHLLNLDLNPNLPQKNKYKNVKIVLLVQDHLKIGKETYLVQDLDQEKIENKSNLTKLQNYGITKEETTMTIGIIVIEITTITKTTSTETMIEEVVDEEEVVLTEMVIKVVTIIGIITIEEDIILTIITMKRTIAKF